MKNCSLTTCSLLCLVMVNLVMPAQINAAEKTPPLPEISIIIDDLGNNRALGLRTAQLPKAVALSILPHTSFSQEIAQIGHQRGMDILLHQPMESLTNGNLLGPGALLSVMDKQHFIAVLTDNLKALPEAIGINNHMGSRLTSNRQKMNWLMEALKRRSLFFIDSRTTSDTIAINLARLWQLPSMQRRVFLDHVDQPAAIEKQFQRLLMLAKKNGYALAIAHPRKNTLAFLEKRLFQTAHPEFKLVAIKTKMSEQINKLSKVGGHKNHSSITDFKSLFDAKNMQYYWHLSR